MWFRSPIFLSLVVVVCIVARTAQEIVTEPKCLPVAGEELIWQYFVRRPPRTDGYQEVDAEYGPTDATITVMTINPMMRENNGQVWVVSGGIDRNYVKLKFRSRRSHGLNYRVCLHGLRRSTSTQPTWINAFRGTLRNSI